MPPSRFAGSSSLPPSRFAGSSSLPGSSILLRLNLALPLDPRDDDVRPSFFSSSFVSSALLARDPLDAPAPSDDARDSLDAPAPSGATVDERHDSLDAPVPPGATIDERRPAAHASLPTHVDDERWRENLGPRGGYRPV